MKEGLHPVQHHPVTFTPRLHWNLPGRILLTGHLDSGGRQCKKEKGGWVMGLQTRISHRLLGPPTRAH